MKRALTVRITSTRITPLPTKLRKTLNLNLPIGMQLIGKPQDEATLFQLAYHFEQAHDFAGQQAPL